MLTETSNKTYMNRVPKRGGRLLWLSILLVLALTVVPSKVHAQLIGSLEVNVPFQFQAGNSKLPAGKYVIHMLDSSNAGTMEIRSEDGSTSALFEVQPVQANSAPAQTELIFNKYGDSYFLAEMYDEGNADGSQALESSYEKRISKENNNHPERKHVSARHGS